ncbi:hypothetical protein S1OALGB6SA_2217 [Olavius algarvensis spirochete endosymbiont]|uniref:DUF3276 family protein n=1 Tax=Olavius algarvensis spirochete endosymbiont TaxID=260710 RepID=UPI000F2CA719|nr:DUF3276 family protein [Olavius algarvensis spirochete endosymbiont]VDB01117.1 hypothetical protein S1OALGB6SA_2217 [Olavius algarvensis spirochete endosymbiont]
MGQRGELYSTRIFIDDGQKTFFFNVKENRYNDRYLNIVESRKTERGFKRSSLVVFDTDIDKFLIVLEKTMEDFRNETGSPEITFTVGSGRREYLLHQLSKGRPALHLIEKREDATGARRESLILPADSFDVFLEALKKAVSMMEVV